jgi:non-specific protein-tyrosine kinase
LLEALSKQADIVLLDTPPVLPVADTLVIGRLAAGAVLVIEARRTPIPAVIRAKDALTRNQTRVLGVALNRLQDRDAGESTGYGYGYGYGYGSGASAGERPRPGERRRGADDNGLPHPELVVDGQAEE